MINSAFPSVRTRLALAVLGVLGTAPAYAANISWLLDGDGNWGTAGNWSSSPALPGAADDVTLDVGGDTRRTVTINTVAAASTLVSQENITLSAGSLTLVGDSAIHGDFLLSGGTLAGAGALTLHGAASSWVSGSMSGTGTTRVAGGVSLAGGGLKDISGRALAVLANGSVNWSNSGHDSGRIRTGGATLSNAGQWNDLNTFNNRIANELNATASSFSNSGTYTKSGAATTEVAIAYHNSGLTDVQAGILSLTGGGSSGGEFHAAAGATLNFGGTSYSFVDGALFSGAGAKNLNGGSFTLNGTITGSNLNLVAGSYSGTHSLAGETEWLGGAFSSGGTTSVVNGASFSLTTGGLKDIAGRTFDVASGATVNWSNSGHDSGRIRTGGATLINAGQWNDLNTFNNRIANELNATASSFSNSGAYTKNGAATTEVAIAYHNSGLTDVQAGMLSLTGGGSSGGEFRASAGATLNFGGTSYSFVDGVLFSGAGAKNLNGGSFTLNGTQTGNNLNLVAGTYSGSHSFAGEVEWQGGAFAASGATAIGAGGAFALTGGNVKDIHARTFSVLAGATLDWSTIGHDAGRIRTGGTTLSNAGQWNDTSAFNNRIANELNASASSFANSGTYTKSGVGVTDIGIALSNSGRVEVNAGTLNFSSAGSNAASGVLEAGAAGTVAFGAGFSFLDGSTLAGAGAKNLNLGTFTIAGTQHVTNLNLVGGTYQGSHGFDGDVDWLGGTFSGAGSTTVLGASSFSLTGGAVKDINGRTLSVAAGGSVNWSNSGHDNGRIRTGGAVLSNAGQWHDQNAFNNRISNELNAVPSSFVNSGSYVRSGPNTTDIAIAFTNTGTVDVQAGALNLSGGGSNGGTGVMQAGALGTLVFSNGFTFADGSSFAGLGAKNLTGGSFTLSGMQHANNLNLVGGTFQGSHQFDGDVEWTGGNFSGAGTTSVTANASLALAGGNLKDINGRTLHVLEGGTLNWSNTGHDNGRIRTGSASLINAGLWHDQSGFNNQLANELGGSASNFTNSGTYAKSGIGTTQISIAYHNSGLTTVQAGALSLNSGGSSGGEFRAETNGTINFGGSGYTFTDGASLSGAGAKNFNGGSFALNGALTVNNLNLLSGTYAGTHTLAGEADWQGGNFAGAGTTTVADGASLSLSSGSLKDISGRTLSVAAGGSLSWSNSGHDSGRIRTGGAVLQNAGQWFDQNTFNNRISNELGGGASSFTNGGTYTKLGAGQTDIGLAFTNTGAVDVQAGTLLFSADVAQHVGNVLNGGTWRVSGSGVLALNEPGAQNIVTNHGDVTLVGASASFARINSLATNNGALRLLGARNFTAVGDFTNNGIVQLGGGSFGATTLTGGAASEIFGFGTVTPTVVNSGRVRASGGVLTFAGGVDGQSGTLQSDAGATLALGANSDGDFLVNNGALALGVFDVTVAVDYSNASFGTGNDFDARAEVTGSGHILAAGDLGQAVSGAISGGDGATPQIQFGNIHVGDVAHREFSVLATGNSGPALRGALQTAAGGGLIDDARLGGSGVSAQNFGPLSVGQNSGPYVVTLSGDFAGALDNQRVAVVNNFDNVAEQVLGISGAVYRYASASALSPLPVDFGKRRVGEVLSQALTVTNEVPADGFSESLDAAFVASSGEATHDGGHIALLGAGASDDSSLAVGLDTSVAGLRSGTVTVEFASNGAGSSGLGITALASQVVDVQAEVYRLASANTVAPVVFANRHVGDAATQFLAVSNTAAADGFSERLNASLGTTSGDVSSNGGAFTLLDAGTSNDVALAVSLDTASAGHKSGTATVAFASDGAGTSGYAAFDLGTQSVEVSGDVYRYASIGPVADLSFGNVHVGDLLSQSLTITNTALDDGYSEALDASFVAASDTRIQFSGEIIGLGAQQADADSLRVTLDTSSAGSVDGVVTLALRSNGAGSSGLGLTALGNLGVGVRTNVGVYRFADAALLSAEPIDLGAARVGDSVALNTIMLANNVAADGFSESLDASFGTSAGGVTATGSVSALAAGATSAALAVALDTSVSGLRGGDVDILLTSNGAGSSGLGTTALATQSVAVSGKVYDIAVADVDVTNIDFGIVHVGDALPTRALTVSNLAGGALTDSLRGALGSLPVGFQASGALPAAGIAAGASSDALSVALDTGVQGVFAGVGTLDFASHNDDMADLALPSIALTLSGQVNAYANPVLTQTGGAGSFTVTGARSFELDFGVLNVGQSGVQGLLALTNLVSGPADLLGADFDVDGGHFTLDGALAFSDLAAGDSHALGINLEPLVIGLFEQVLRMHLYGGNGGGYHGDLGSFEITLRASVQAAPVPLPAPLWLLGAGLASLALRRRRTPAGA
ncbi:MAG: choice-of-anchor D domain-containing protein [Proteobacteria bacterium]|nr:choice-of-anchor D domain-containing protein [Pseudomonadota bacterium]